MAVLGNIGNSNTGDEALLAVTLAALGPDPLVTVLSRDPTRTTAMHDVAAVHLLGRTAMGVLARCDAVVVVGGGMFGPGLPPLVRVLPIMLDLAALVGRSVAYVGIGVYAGVPRATLAALRRATSRATVSVTVRDPESARLLSGTAPPPCVGDLALALPPAPRGDARALLRATGIETSRPLLLLAPKSGTSAAQTRAIVDAGTLAATHWNRLGGAVAGIALSGHVDYGLPVADHDAPLIDRIGAHAGLDIPVVGPDLAPALARAVVAEASAVVGHRFHGMVFAAGQGVPATGYTWEAKTKAFFTEHGLDEMSDPLVPHELRAWLSAAFDGAGDGAACGSPDPRRGAVPPCRDAS